ncbi:unnamed protein product [Chondrus crispus]|uniref:Uncharacterized protein n=1 Tax=Chondrus crispus TaxID=2769 RepID=R7Q3G9_CHOCR|nr:unnamed protein product [Chondrus crispus]CDF32438.1 unnamed protein product [Chondrus crispus]|eukprot:XP_005712103.1 unnamed protein product [Chondrus crispus]
MLMGPGFRELRLREGSCVHSMMAAHIGTTAKAATMRFVFLVNIFWGVGTWCTAESLTWTCTFPEQKGLWQRAKPRGPTIVHHTLLSFHHGNGGFTSRFSALIKSSTTVAPPDILFTIRC